MTEREISDQLLSLDLQGVLQYNQIDIPGIYTLATCLIDYQGERIMAQSIFPGLFSGTIFSNLFNCFFVDPAVQIVYGIDDSGTIQTDPEFHALLLEAAKSLHIEVFLKISNDS